MKFTCSSNALQKLVGIVEKAVPSRTSVPVLENIYLELNNGWLTARGNNLEFGIQDSIQVEDSDQPGSVLIKSKTLSTVLAKMQNKTLTLFVNEAHKLSLVGEQVDFELLGQPVSDYPDFPNPNEGTTFTLKSGDLMALIRHTIFSASDDESKPFLNGILVKVQDGNLIFVATDGYRLALKSHQKEGLVAFSAIVPSRMLSELARILQVLGNESDVQLTFSDAQFVCKANQFMLLSRLVEGKFPDYNQVIPKNPVQQFLVSRRLFLDACERASIMAAESKQVMRLAISDEKVVLRAVASSMGEFYEELKLSRQSGSGETKIAFNVKLVLDALRNMDSDDVRISFNDGLSPCVFEPSSGSEYLYVVMPIRTNEFKDEQAVPQPVAEGVQV